MIRRIAVMAAGALAASALLVPTGSAATPERADSAGLSWPAGTEYVAMGDSFAAGPGILPYVTGSPSNCGRSTRNYASLFAERSGLDLVDVSCGGAQTKHFTEVQGGNDPQFDALSADTDVVTFGTMGGNDIGLVGLAMSCVTGTCTPAAGTDPLQEEFDQLASDLSTDLADAQTRAPNARILVVGYGTYLPPTGCAGAVPGVSEAEAAYLQSQIDRLSDLLDDTAAQAQVEFIDMRTIPGVLEHTACAVPHKQWIRALNTYNDGVQLHPSYCGMDAWAQHLVRSVQELDGLAVTEFDSSCVSAPGLPTEPTPTEPTPTEPTTPAPTTPAPTQPVPTQQTPEQLRAARLAALRAAAATVTLRTSCRGTTVRFTAAGGSGHVERARFKVGATVVGKATEAPFRVTRAVRRLPARGKVGVRTVLRDGDLSVTRSFKVKRPRCL